MEKRVINKINLAKDLNDLLQIVRFIDNEQGDLYSEQKLNEFYIQILKRSDTFNVANDYNLFLLNIIVHNTDLKTNSYNQIVAANNKQKLFLFNKQLIDKIVESAICRKEYETIIAFYSILKDSFNASKSRNETIKTEYDESIKKYADNLDTSNYYKLSTFSTIIKNKSLPQDVKLSIIKNAFYSVEYIPEIISSDFMTTFLLDIFENYQKLKIDDDGIFKYDLFHFIFGIKKFNFLIIFYPNILERSFDSFLRIRPVIKVSGDNRENVVETLERYFDILKKEKIKNLEQSLITFLELFYISEQMLKLPNAKNIILNRYLSNEIKNEAISILIEQTVYTAKKLNNKSMIYNLILEIMRNVKKLNNNINNFNCTLEENNIFDMEDYLKEQIAKTILLERLTGLNVFLDADFHQQVCDFCEEIGLKHIYGNTNNKVEVSSFDEKRPLYSLLRIYENEYCEGCRFGNKIQQIVNAFDKTHNLRYVDYLKLFFTINHDLTGSFADFISYDYFKYQFNNDNRVSATSLTKILTNLGIDFVDFKSNLLYAQEAYEEKLREEAKYYQLDENSINSTLAENKDSNKKENNAKIKKEEEQKQQSNKIEDAINDIDKEQSNTKQEQSWDEVD